MIYVRYRDYGYSDGDVIEYTTDKELAFKESGYMIFDCVKEFTLEGEHVASYVWNYSHKEWQKSAW